MNTTKNKAAVELGRLGGQKLRKLKGKKYFKEIDRQGGLAKKKRPLTCG